MAPAVHETIVRTEEEFHATFEQISLSVILKRKLDCVWCSENIVACTAPSCILLCTAMQYVCYAFGKHMTGIDKHGRSDHIYS